MRRCVYTVLYGSLDRLPEQPVSAESGLDFIAFVGDPTVTSKTWDVRHLPPLFIDDPVRSARYAKLLPHRLLPDYDASLYIDCTVRLKQTPEALFADLLDGHSTMMACLRHPERSDVLAEALTVIDLGYDDPAMVLAQVAAYRRAGLIGEVPMIWSGLLLRLHHEPAVVACMERWFAHVLRYSRRDQIAFPFVAEELRFEFLAHDRSVRDSAWHVWPVPLERSRASHRGGPPAAKFGSALSQQAAVAALAEAERRLHRAEAALATMRASRCWRATAGLRSLVNRWRRLRVRFPAATGSARAPAARP